MRLVGFAMLHLARHSKLGQLPPVTRALVRHCPSGSVGSRQPEELREEHFAWTYAHFQCYYCSHF